MNTWTPAEQAEHRRLWVEALRSGKYSRGRYFLKSGDSFCCLGVACDISGLGGWSIVEGREVYTVGNDNDRCYLIDPVRDWLGLTSARGAHGGKSLSYLNDTGTPFAEIADIIESEPPGFIALPSKETTSE